MAVISCLTNLLSTLRYSVAYCYTTQKLQYSVWGQKVLVAPWVAVPPSLPKLCYELAAEKGRAGMNVEKKYIVIKFFKQKLKIQFIHEDLRISFYSINLFWQKLQVNIIVKKKEKKIYKKPIKSFHCFYEKLPNL